MRKSNILAINVIKSTFFLHLNESLERPSANGIISQREDIGDIVCVANKAMYMKVSEPLNMTRAVRLLINIDKIQSGYLSVLNENWILNSLAFFLR